MFCPIVTDRENIDHFVTGSPARQVVMLNGGTGLAKYILAARSINYNHIDSCF